MTRAGNTMTREDMTAERRVRYVVDEPTPEGWRFLRFQAFDDDGITSMAALYTSAPEGVQNPVSTEWQVAWFRCRRVTQRRYVTPWEDV